MPFVSRETGGVNDTWRHPIAASGGIFGRCTWWAFYTGRYSPIVAMPFVQFQSLGEWAQIISIQITAYARRTKDWPLLPPPPPPPASSTNENNNWNFRRTCFFKTQNELLLMLKSYLCLNLIYTYTSCRHLFHIFRGLSLQLVKARVS